MRILRTLYLLGWVLIPGYWTLTGLEKVMYYEGESLRVQCHYEKWLKRNTKFWCKDSTFMLCSSLFIKSSSEALVKDGRVSIRDNKTECYFEITMDELKQEDSGTYQCGIERRLFNDRHYIQVNVSPGPKSILIYCIIPLSLLLLAAAIVLLIVSRKKKKGWKREKEIKPQSLVLAHNTVNGGREHSIPGHHLGTDGTGLYSNVEVHLVHNHEELPSQEKTSDKKDEVFYATLNISSQQQQSTDANIGFFSSPVLSKTQEIFYAEVAITSKE